MIESTCKFYVKTMQKFAGVKLQYEAVFPPGVTYLQPRLVSVIRVTAKRSMADCDR